MTIKLLKKVLKNKKLTDNERSSLKAIIHNMKTEKLKEISHADLEERIIQDIYHKYCGQDCGWEKYSKYIENIMEAINVESSGKIATGYKVTCLSINAVANNGGNDK